MKFLLSFVLITISLSTFATEVAERVETFENKLIEFFDECAGVYYDVSGVSFEKVDTPKSKKELMSLVKKQLRSDIPEASNIPDSEFFSNENNLFSDIESEEVCEEAAKELIYNKVWQGSYAVNEADEGGDVYKFQTIYNSEYYILTFYGFHSN